MVIQCHTLTSSLYRYLRTTTDRRQDTAADCVRHQNRFVVVANCDILLSAGLLTILPKSIANTNTNILGPKSIGNSNRPTNTFYKSIAILNTNTCNNTFARAKKLFPRWVFKATTKHKNKLCTTTDHCMLAPFTVHMIILLNNFCVHCW